MRLRDQTKQAVHLQRTIFESMDERDAFYAGEIARIDPDRISEFTYERLNCGLLVNTGRNYVAKALRETSVASGGNPDTTVRFIAANTYLGVGDSTTAAATSQTDLQAATNKQRKVMDTGFPKIQGENYDRANPTTGATETVTPTNGDFVCRTTWAGTEAAFKHVEFAIFNAAAGGTMLDRFIGGSNPDYQGTKPTGVNQVWEETITCNFA